MRILYVFPHPDDESFGAGAALAAQIRQGHRVDLLTLTRGGATRQRHRLGLTIEEMGEVRYREMQAVAEVMGLGGLTVLDLPDSGLKELDPRVVEEAVRRHVLATTPDVLVTYAVHGISGFHDHLVGHAAVKRVFCELRERPEASPRRLALYTLVEVPDRDGPFHLNTSQIAEVDAIVETSEADRDVGRRALACYETYRETIDKVGEDILVPERVYFEFFQENYDPPLPDICGGL
jgi:LmbE family N-acetylglucosaminyl deacetylase